MGPVICTCQRTNAHAKTHVANYSTTGAVADIDEAIRYVKQAIPLTSDEHVRMPGLLNILGTLSLQRFKYLKELGNLDEGIQYKAQAIALVPDDHVNKMIWLHDLGFSHMARFQGLGEINDIDQAIKHHKKALSLSSDEGAILRGCLIGLGSSHMDRFKCRGEINDINEAINYQTEAVLLVADGDPDKPNYLTFLGLWYLNRFEHYGTTEDINRATECQVKILSLTSDDHIDRPDRLTNAGSCYLRRFERFGEIGDIEQAIEYQTHALSLIPDGQAETSKLLSNLATSYANRFYRLGQLEDLDQAIEHQSQALLLTHGCLTHMPWMSNNMGNLRISRFDRLGELEDAEEAINHHIQAASLTPASDMNRPMWLNNLGYSLMCRFKRLGQLEDIDKAIEHLIQAISLTTEDYANWPMLQNSLGNLHESRFNRIEDLADLDKAIEHHIQAVESTPEDHVSKPERLHNLGSSLRSRFECIGHRHDINQAILCHTQAVELALDGHPDQSIWLDSLGLSLMRRFELLGNKYDIDEAVEHQKRATLLISDGAAGKPSMINNLGISYSARFTQFGDLCDIDEAITQLKKAVSLTPDGHMLKPEQLRNLAASHLKRFEHLDHSADIRKCVDYFMQCTKSPTGNPLLKFQSSVHWARLSVQYSISSPLDAYRQAITLVHQVVWLGTTIDRRYELIQSDVEGLAAEAASVAISYGAYEEAVQWLEAGRSIVWNQQLQLRSSFEELAIVDAALSKRFETVSRELDYVSRPQTEQYMVSQNAALLERDARQHRSIAKDWEKLVEDIRTLPAFRDFLLPKTFMDLSAFAQSNAIVIVNASHQRPVCDALVLLPGATSCKHIELPLISYEKATSLQEELVSIIKGTQTLSRSSRRPIHPTQPVSGGMESILESLWTDVVRPVLHELGYFAKSLEVGVPLPCITWCPTGPMAFLPLHAAGCYEEPGERAFQYFISSYTPTISALGKSSHIPIEFKGILAVGQADARGSEPLPGTIMEISDIEVMTCWKTFTRLESHNATVAAVLNAIETHSWIHLACHASQSLADPLASAFILHDRSLSLRQIAEKPLKHADFAFLSACETARGYEGLPDEAIHLAAGMMMAGYPSVVATMWSILDEDAPIVAKEVYACMLAGGVPDARKAARGLHSATARLRDRIGEKEFLRWVPYIHMGT